MKALVLGGTGFLGTHLCNELIKRDIQGHRYIPITTGSEYDLLDSDNTSYLLNRHKPDVIFHLAAYVGGIGLNMKTPGDMFYKNMQMGMNVIEGFKFYNKIHPNTKLIVVGTVCMYPKHTPVPFKEEALWNGFPEETNAPYGIAKKSLMVMSEAYRKQYNTNIVFVIPSNLYGPNDNFDYESSHVIPAIIRKIHEAKENNESTVTLWGTGNATREFLYVKDCAKALRFIGENYNSSKPVNIAVNKDISIKDLAKEISNIVGYNGSIKWDTSMPDGQPKRRVSNERLINAGFNHTMTNLNKGLEETYDWFRKLKRTDRANSTRRRIKKVS